MIVDGVIPLFCLWMLLLQSLVAQRLGGRDGYCRNKAERPRPY